ncbi:MAG: PilZ domain-containing protein [Candidatus Omnitrophica bacterium]|nr:PilZ domain-containing protein [Candidatus Omnitrophota bacterium]MBU1923441.1 PilZ domain-containing protein [Candidatus Omnitrophota bacterium]
MVILGRSKENRCFPRVGFHSQIRYQLRGKPDFDNVLSNDISCGGVRFTSERFIPTSTLVMLEINVLNRVLRPIGKIAWSAPVAHSDRNQTGVEFMEFNAPERNYLRDFVNMQLGEA